MRFFMALAVPYYARAEAHSLAYNENRSSGVWCEAVGAADSEIGTTECSSAKSAKGASSACKQMGNGVGQGNLHSEWLRPDLVQVRAPLGYNPCRPSQVQTVRQSTRVVVIQHAGDSPEVARAEHGLQLRR
jgi:hypothetical protein